MQLILLFFILIAVLFFIVVGTVLKVVMKVKNAFSPNSFTSGERDSEDAGYSQSNSQLVTCEAGRRRLNKLKASAQDAEIIYEQK